MNLNNYYIKNNGHLKCVTGKDYNYIFNRKNGFFVRWGATKEDNPQYSPIGPEILDIEVSTVCHRSCSWCYKSNNLIGKNMALETFKKILEKIPQNLTQIAFGIGDIDANPDLWKIFEHCQKRNTIPNITINGDRLNSAIADKLIKYCGAVAISHYDNDTCFNAVKLLLDRGLKQVNIHKLVAKETLDSCYELLNLSNRDPRLSRLNAIVFLSLKKKGERNNYHTLSTEEFSELINYAIKCRARIGFDSCSANKILEILRDQDNYQMIELMSEPCESCCFSLYINVEGIVYPCSFLEDEYGFEGIDIISSEDFLSDIWFSPNFNQFRNKLLKINRNCPQFKI